MDRARYESSSYALPHFSEYVELVIRDNLAPFLKVWCDMTKYIGLMKFRKKPTREMIKQNLELIEKDKKAGVQVREIFWTLGRYDAVVIFDAPDEKAAMKMAMERGENMSAETMVAIPAEEARKLVE